MEAARATIPETMPARRAIYGGSFDPPTIGHSWVIEQGAAMFDELHVAVGVNPDKRSMFSPDERMEMLEDIASPYPNVTVGQFGKLFLVDYAQQTGYNFVLRGLRSADDFNAEKTMSSLNRDIGPEIRTAFVICPDELAKISSSVIKGLVGFEGWEEPTGRYVSPFVLEALKSTYSRKSATN